MAKILPTAAARADLLEIRQYSLQEFGPDVADAYFAGFERAFGLLVKYPLAGPSRPEYGKGYRCLVQGRHRIFYTVNGDIVIIVRILHHAMDAKRVLKGATH